MVKIHVRKLHEDKHMEATNEEGGSVRLDGSRAIGGLDGGMSPMQLLLAASGGCSMIDIVGILKKQRQPLESIEVDVDGDRQDVETWSEYKTIHLHFTLKGDLEEKRVAKAIELSLGKYCSVSKTLEKSGSRITHSFEIQRG